MGMYDEIAFDYLLPDGEVQQEQFQTKDLGSYIDKYFVDGEGVIWKYNLIWDRTIPEVTRTRCGDLSQIINIYTSTEDRLSTGQIEYRWWSYDVTIEKGFVIKITRADDHWINQLEGS
jgi:hypothetical protein